MVKGIWSTIDNVKKHLDIKQIDDMHVFVSRIFVSKKYTKIDRYFQSLYMLASSCLLSYIKKIFISNWRKWPVRIEHYPQKQMKNRQMSIHKIERKLQGFSLKLGLIGIVLVGVRMRVPLIGPWNTKYTCPNLNGSKWTEPIELTLQNVN